MRPLCWVTQVTLPLGDKYGATFGDRPRPLDILWALIAPCGPLMSLFHSTFLVCFFSSMNGPTLCHHDSEILQMGSLHSICPWDAAATHAVPCTCGWTCIQSIRVPCVHPSLCGHKHEETLSPYEHSHMCYRTQKL